MYQLILKQNKMKKIILTAAAIFAFGFANAQSKATKAEAKEEAKEMSGYGFAPGNIFVEGSLSFGNSKRTQTPMGGTIQEDKKSDVSFTPKVGFFVTDKFAVGVSLEVASTKNTTTTTTFGSPSVVTSTETKGSTFGAGVFARYYFLNLGERFKTYTELGLGFDSTKDKLNGVEQDKVSRFNAGLSLGMNYFVTKNMAISFSLANVLAFNSGKTDFPVTDGAGNQIGTDTDKTNGFNGRLNDFNNFFDTPTFGLLYKF